MKREIYFKIKKNYGPLISECGAAVILLQMALFISIFSDKLTTSREAKDKLLVREPIQKII